MCENDAILCSFWNQEKTTSRFHFPSVCAISVISTVQEHTYLFFNPHCLVLCSPTLCPTYFLHPLVLRWLSALVDTVMTPRIQLINRSNFATDAIFLSSSSPPQAGPCSSTPVSESSPLPASAHPPFPQQTICPPAGVTVLSHEDPCVVPAGAARVSLHPGTQ